MLSINDRPLVRELFGRCAFQEVPVTYTVCFASGDCGQRAGELIVLGPG